MREEARRAEGDPTMARQDVEKVMRMMQMMKAMMAMMQMMTIVTRATQLHRTSRRWQNMGLAGVGDF